MIGIYERSLCQSYASAYRAGIKIGEAETREDALKQVEAMTEDSYQCFAVDDDVKCMRCDKCGELIIGDDPHGTFRGALWPSEIESFDLCRDCSVEVQRFIHGRNEVKAHEDHEHDQGE